MKLLLDTHALLWWLQAPELLGARSRDAIAEESATVLVSTVSAFEIATKYRIGKLPQVEELLSEFADRVRAENFDILPVGLDHALLAGSLVIEHKDPFDRLLIAQAMVEQIFLVSNEKRFDRYGVRRLW